MSDTTGRDRVWGLALRVARDRNARGYLEEFGVQELADVADDRELGVSKRSVRRTLNAMAETGVLEVASDRPRRYRLAPAFSVPNVTETTEQIGEPRYTIYHLFADDGIESERLSDFGTVIRVGIDPRKTPFGHVVKADATKPPLKPDADLAVAHPPCYEWAIATRDERANKGVEYENLIPETREVCRNIADHYIIENQPGSPLQDPVHLRGSMFYIPLEMERTFETSYPVPQPGKREENPQQANWYYNYSRPYSYWKTVKGYGHKHRKDPFLKSGIPQPYIDFLLRYWIIEIQDIDVDVHSLGVPESDPTASLDSFAISDGGDRHE